MTRSRSAVERASRSSIWASSRVVIETLDSRLATALRVPVMTSESE